MLQQTQVKTVIPYFIKFIKKYPNINSLSRAKKNSVMKLWEGLGYYRRARFLLQTSKIIVYKYKLKLPSDLNKIKELPGVGDYTANILSALVNNKATIGIDGNVKRVFSRIFNIREEKINFKKIFSLNQKKLFLSGRNSDFAEAIMEFGALMCKPTSPNCSKCNIKKNCKSFMKKKIISLKNSKKISKKEYDIFCHINKNKQIALTKKNKLGFLQMSNMPIVKKRSKNINSNWFLLKNYNNIISNKKLNINLYYKFSSKIPDNLNWFSMERNKDFIPTFTKKIFKQLVRIY